MRMCWWILMLMCWLIYTLIWLYVCGSSGCSSVEDAVWFPHRACLCPGTQRMSVLLLAHLYHMCIFVWVVWYKTTSGDDIQYCVLYHSATGKKYVGIHSVFFFLWSSELPQSLCLQKHSREWLVAPSTNGEVEDLFLFPKMKVEVS